ncbi:MAG TPA: sulfate ABC transporter substrate-binding protein [Ardenticatenaceae bacterium]|nr:sulfate ABC transporter substrate-binding protein [Ardenticatenaceae bacterium]
MKRNRRWAGIVGLILVLLLVAGCGGTAAPAAQGEQGAGSGGEGGSGDRVTLILGAYTTPREAYGEIIPLFQAHWKEQTGQDVVFEESYLGSGAQSRAIVEGFEADIAALSLEADINRIANAGLITHDWKAVGEYNGMVSTSIVVMAVRAGNPKGIQDWANLAQDGVEVLTPDPATSGGAQWNVMAMYGAARRGHVEGFSADDEGALDFLRAVFNNVTVLDKGARESITNYEKGIGDVAITYENEVLVGQANGQDYEYVIPSSTILIENPVAVIDANVDEHGTREVAEAFVEFLYRPEVQRIFAEHGLRSVDQAVAQETSEQYPAVEDLFTIEEFGGWSQVTEPFFGEEGIYTKMIQEVQGG